jgi:signal transduction histidine kinase
VEHGSTNSRPKADDSEGSEIPRTTGEAGDSVEHGSTDNQPQAGDGSGLTVRVGPLDGGFYVEDTGRGIPPSERDRVFDHGYTTGDGGSGVGLTIVNRVAQVHGWDVSVGESREGGARFEFRDGGAGED